MVWAIEQAKEAGVCGTIHVATDSEVTARMAREAGAEVPFLRTDDVDDITSVGKAAANVVRRYSNELGRRFDLVCLLLATSPLRSPTDIVGCRDLLLENDSLDASGSVVQAEKHPAWAWRIIPDGRMVSMFPNLCHRDRHELEPAYFYDGAVYWAWSDFFQRVDGNQYLGDLGAYVMENERSVDVDTPLDWAFAEFLLQRQLRS